MSPRVPTQVLILNAPMRPNHSHFIHRAVTIGNHGQRRLGKEASQEDVVGRELGHRPLPREGEEGGAEGGGVGPGEEAEEMDAERGGGGRGLKRVTPPNV